MSRLAVLTACLVALVSPSEVSAQPAAVGYSPTPSELAGTWAGALEHDGDRQPFALHLEPSDSGRIAVRVSIPVVHLDRVDFGRPRLVVNGDSIRLGPFRLRYDREGPTLTGAMPSSLVPVYDVRFVLCQLSPEGGRRFSRHRLPAKLIAATR